MPRLHYIVGEGWWQFPLIGEAGPIRYIGEEWRGPDNPPPLVPDYPELPEPMVPESERDPLPGDYEDATPMRDETARFEWYEYWQAWARGELLDPLDEQTFDPLAYRSAGACTVPAQHPPPGTLIGLPNAPGSTHDPNVAPNNWQSDNAVDIWLYPGTVVRACAAGRVSLTYGYGYSGPPESRFGGARLHVEHASGMVSFYQHLERITIRRGATVRRGQALGRSGFGNCVPHLHFAVTPPSDPRAYARFTYDRNAPPNPPPPPVEPRDEPPPRPLRGPEQAWSNLMHAIGPNRRAYKRRVVRARRAGRKALE